MNHDTKPLTRKQRWIRRAILIVVVAVLWKTVPPFGSGYTVSRETTYVTPPVGKDGYVDYFAAHYELFGKGVKPEDNAAIAIMRAIDPADLPPAWYAAVAKDDWENDGPKLTDLDAALRRMRIDPRVLDDPMPAEESKQEVDPGIVLSPEMTARLGMLPTPTAAQWREARAMFAQWFIDSDDALDRVAAATNLPDFYLPPVPSPDGNASLLEAEVPLSQLVVVARDLLRRAKQRRQSGDFTGAWQDTHALLRLGRLATQQPSSISNLVACHISFMACDAMQPLLASGELSAEEMLRAVNQLPSPAPFVHTVVQGDRLVMLDSMAEELYRGTGGDPHTWYMRWRTVPFDGPARRINDYFDGLVAAAQLPDWLSRRSAAAALRATWDEKCEADRDWRGVVGYRATRIMGSRSMMARVVGDRTITIMMSVVVPSITAAFDTVAEGEGYQVSLRAALACAAYREAHSQWPDRLNDLVPDYLPNVPVDPCSNQLLCYRRIDKGMIVYTIGKNGVDDDGPPKSDVSRFNEEPWFHIDDFGYRIGYDSEQPHD